VGGVGLLVVVVVVGGSWFGGKAGLGWAGLGFGGWFGWEYGLLGGCFLTVSGTFYEVCMVLAVLFVHCHVQVK
jgi:hypothetical protein